METSVRVQNLSVKLGGTFWALRGVSLELPVGQIIGCIGPSGAGKTTLIKVLVGLQKATSGSVQVLGLAPTKGKLRGQFSYMTQSLSIYPDLTVKENLDYFARMLGLKRAERKRQLALVLHEVNLTKQVNQLVSDLSGGQKQRVSLAVALLGDPKLLFLDEPTVGLDPILREELWELFRKLVDGGKTIILSSHVMDEADRCDDLLLIRDGKLLAHAPPKELCRQTSSKTVEESFIKLVEGQA
ncbi:MAG TPA: ABC transporter ATP-binding protein [Candidatus Saccharimonadales bacterium]|nr:ABC transporter ATP-binding protein [Candidatus Saccharimonadales bacterium]